MKKAFKMLAIIGVLAISIFISFTIMKNTNTSTENTEENKPKNEIPRELVAHILDHMTIEQKVGQMLIIRNLYTSMNSDFKTEISDIQPGGYIIFGENITTLTDTSRFISDTRNEIETTDSVTIDGKIYKIPAFMSVDQEGGLVQRLQMISDYPPEYVASMAEIGASGSANLAYETGLKLGEECKSIGLNLNFAPVADIFSNPENTVIGNRAFGTDKETVATMSTALARGLSDSGIIPTFKHFPGHGDTAEDSHVSLPVVTKTIEELAQNELYPFQKAIASGAEMIMVAHIALPNVTGDYTPASLSPTVITDILKKQLNYNGLIITDGLDMGALTENYSNAEIAIKAIKAGADILLTPVSPIETKNAILDAIRDGTLSEERIDESVSKILKLKFKYL